MTTNPADAADSAQIPAVPPGDCILFATADWDTPYWTNKQHTADHLAKAGWRVLYVESIGLRAPRMGSGTDWRRVVRRLWRGLKGPRPMQNQLWVLSPLVIPFKHHHPWIRRFNQGFSAWSLARFCRSNAFKTPLLWTYHPYVLEQLAILERQYGMTLGKLVYHCVDDLSAIPGIDANAFSTEEKRLLEKADTVFTTSQSLFKKCQKHNDSVYDYPNVVDFEHFARAHQDGAIPQDLASIPQPRLGYVGALSDFKVDFELLQEIATMHPEWHFIAIGDEREGQQDPVLLKLKLLPNVHHLGHRPYEQLPAYLRGLSLGLLPTRLNPYTLSMFPMKYFEYIASGLRVVATPLDFTRKHRGGIETGSDAVSFAAAISAQLSRGRLSELESIEHVGLHTWTTRLTAMLSKVYDARHPTPRLE